MVYNWYENPRFGRRNIYTAEREITSENIIQVLQDTFLLHQENTLMSQYLLDYDSGIQPILQRSKAVRPNICNKVIDNIASEITEFKLGFNWPTGISFVRRGEKDSGKGNELDGLTLLNECYEAENIKSKRQQMARYTEITGWGYMFVDPNTDWHEGDSYFHISPLDPRFTYMVYSSYYIDRRAMLGVTYSLDTKTGNVFYTAFTPRRRYEVMNLSTIVKGMRAELGWSHGDRSDELNPLGYIPIVRCMRSHDGTGCFEKQLSAMDDLNLLESNYTDGVEQAIQAIYQANDIAFPLDEDGKVIVPKDNDWIVTETTADGKQPFIKAIEGNVDYSGMLSNIEYRRNLILQKCNVPERNKNSGGSTGIAMDSATGWAEAENAANKQQALQEMYMMDEVKVVLAAIKLCKKLPADSPLRKLRYSDVQPNIQRQKTYELTTKVNGLATLMSHGIAPEHAIKTVNLFGDPNQVYTDSQPYIKRYLASIYDKQKQQTAGSPQASWVQRRDGSYSSNEQKVNSSRTMQDRSDQEGNSPHLGK
jgi:hypothetical protein